MSTRHKHDNINHIAQDYLLGYFNVKIDEWAKQERKMQNNYTKRGR